MPGLELEFWGGFFATGTMGGVYGLVTLMPLMFPVKSNTSDHRAVTSDRPIDNRPGFAAPVHRVVRDHRIATKQLG
jgi:hypothetical protein